MVSNKDLLFYGSIAIIYYVYSQITIVLAIIATVYTALILQKYYRTMPETYTSITPTFAHIAKGNPLSWGGKKFRLNPTYNNHSFGPQYRPRNAIIS